MKGSKTKMIRRSIFRGFVAAIVLTIAILVTANCFLVSAKVLRTEIQLALIYSEIDLYNQNLEHGSPSQTYHQYAKELADERLNLAHSNDPVIRFSAKKGFSFILFLGSLLLFPGFFFLWYCGFKNKKKVLYYAEILLVNILKYLIYFLICITIILVKVCLDFSGLFLIGGWIFSLEKVKLMVQLDQLRSHRHKRKKRKKRTKRANSVNSKRKNVR